MMQQHAMRLWLARVGRPELMILAFALVLRLVIVQHATWAPFSDTRDYHVLAHNLAQGEGYFQVYEGEASEYQGMTQRAFRVPGYPAFLALIYTALGWDPSWAYLANVACEMATLLLILAIGRFLFGRRTARIALGLFALHILWTPNLMTESLFTGMLAALFVLVVRGRATRSPIGALSFGVLLAAAVFVRPIAVTVLPLFVYELFRPDRSRRTLLGVLALLPLLVSLGLWSARNQQQLGQSVALSTNLGSHNTASFGLDRQSLVQGARRRGLGEAEIDRELRQAIRREILAEPARAAWIYLQRAAGLLALEPAWEVTFLRQATFAGPNGSAWAEVLYRVSYWQYFVVYPLALLGAFGLLWARRGLPLALLLLSFIAVHAFVSEGNIRFAAPLYPFLCLMAGYGIDRLLAGRRPAPILDTSSP